MGLSYLYNGNSCTGKTTSLFWDGPLIVHISYYNAVDWCKLQYFQYFSADDDMPFIIAQVEAKLRSHCIQFFAQVKTKLWSHCIYFIFMNINRYFTLSTGNIWHTGLIGSFSLLQCNSQLGSSNWKNYVAYLHVMDSQDYLTRKHAWNYVQLLKQFSNLVMNSYSEIKETILTLQMPVPYVYETQTWWSLRDHFVYVLSQWDTTLQCNVVSHWLDTYTKWSCITVPADS